MARRARSLSWIFDSLGVPAEPTKPRPNHSAAIQQHGQMDAHCRAPFHGDLGELEEAREVRLFKACWLGKAARAEAADERAGFLSPTASSVGGSGMQPPTLPLQGGVCPTGKMAPTPEMQAGYVAS